MVFRKSLFNGDLMEILSKQKLLKAYFDGNMTKHISLMDEKLMP